MKKLLILLLFCGILSADIAQGMVRLGLSYATQNPQSYKTALKSLLDEMNSENLSDYDLVPKFIKNFVDESADERTLREQKRQLRVISNAIDKYANLSRQNLYNLFSVEIENLSDEAIMQALNGQILMSDYMKKRNFASVKTALTPTIRALCDDELFVDAFFNLTGENPQISHLNEKIAEEMFSLFKKGENGFNTGINALLILQNLMR